MDKYIIVEVADNPVSLAQGLMGRKEMPVDRGMLFKFPSITDASFWGKNTYMPLDIAFVDANNRIGCIKHITPMSTRLVSGGFGYSMAIEANQGFFKNNNITEGHTISLSESKDNELKIIFRC